MTNYTKTTNFTAKDSLTTGDPLKVVKGEEIDDELNALQTAVNSKADINSPIFTGEPKAVTVASGDNSTKIATTAYADAVIPTGAVFYFAFSTVPSGFLLCNGAAVSRATYSTLYTAIGDTFGAGDGSTTFELPNLLGQFVRGWNEADAGSPDNGRTFGDIQADAITDHDHYFAVPEADPDEFPSQGVSTFHDATKEQVNRLSFYRSAAINAGGDAFTSASNSGAYDGNIGIDSVNHLDSSADTTVESETRPTNMALLPCIKT